MLFTTHQYGDDELVGRVQVGIEDSFDIASANSGRLLLGDPSRV
jgi:hypothetical protein